MGTDIGDELVELGAFEAPDADALLQRLKEENIRFEIQTADSALKNSATTEGGTLGYGAVIRITVPSSDYDRAAALCRQVIDPGVI